MPDDGDAWGDAYTARYAAESRRSRERRYARARARARARAQSPDAVATREAELNAAIDRLDARFAQAKRIPGFAMDRMQFVEALAKEGDPDAGLIRRSYWADHFAQRQRQRRAACQALVQRRLKEGFRWSGGAVGGNPAYRRAPFVQWGTVSREDPILRLFVASTPRAARLLTGDTKAEVTGTDSKLLALDCPYVVANGTMRRVLRVELDRIFAGGVVSKEPWQQPDIALAMCTG